MSIGDAIAQLLTAKKSGNRRERYTTGLLYYLNQFSKGRENLPLSSFTTAEIEEWMSKYKSAWTRQTWLNRLSTLFSWAVRRGHIEKNPCDRIERVTVDRSPPKILTPAEAELLLKIVPEMLRPYLVLGLFVGIRPEEITRLQWVQINLETKTVQVDGKTRRRRIVPLEPRAVALLSECRLKTGQVEPSGSSIRRFKVKARTILGLLKWPQDLLRHTAASYLLAIHKDAGKVAMMLGNSASILLSHYHEPVTDQAAAFFWSLDGHNNYDPVIIEAKGRSEQTYPSGKIERSNQPESNGIVEPSNLGIGGT